MTLTKAKEILTHLLSTSSRDKSPDSWDAMKLGLEALKACKKRADRFPNIPNLKLPSETRED